MKTFQRTMRHQRLWHRLTAKSRQRNANVGRRHGRLGEGRGLCSQRARNSARNRNDQNRIKWGAANRQSLANTGNRISAIELTDGRNGVCHQLRGTQVQAGRLSGARCFRAGGRKWKDQCSATPGSVRTGSTASLAQRSPCLGHSLRRSSGVRRGQLVSTLAHDIDRMRNA